MDEYGDDGLDTGYGTIGEYGGTGDYTTDAGTEVTVEDHSGSGYADVYGPGYGADDTYSNYQAAGQDQTELYNESTQAYLNGDVQGSYDLNAASQQAGAYADDQYSAYYGTGDYSAEQAAVPDYTDPSGLSEEPGYTGSFDSSDAGEALNQEEDDYLSS